MVLKRRRMGKRRKYPFENDVKKYGTQTAWNTSFRLGRFENDVKKYGTQTITR